MVYTKSHILTVCMVLVTIASVGFSFYRYMILRYYMIHMEVPCDPTTESCFVSVCDPATDTECVVEEEESYHKFILKKAYLMPDCDPQDSACVYPSCEGDETCEETLCVPEELEEGEVCDML